MAEITILPVVNSIILQIRKHRFGNRAVDDVPVEHLLKSVCGAIKDADAKRHSRADIDKWLTDVKTVLYDLDDALDEENQTTNPLFKYSYPPPPYSILPWRPSLPNVNLDYAPDGKYKMGYLSHSNIKEDLRDDPDAKYTRGYMLGTNTKFHIEKLLVLVKKIIKLDLRLSKCSLKTSTAMKQTSMIQRSSFFHESNSCVIQREDDKYELISKLLGLADVKGPSAVAVVGMTGIGKTTLAKLVYADEATHCFHTKLWVSCSPDPNVSVRRILCGIADALGLYITLSESKAMLVDMITSPLKNTRYLLVLDNVRVESRPFWVELKSILDVGKTGSAILITTKSNKVAFSAQSVKIHKLKCLSYSACLNIFEQTAFKKGEAEKYPMLRTIGAQILSKWDRVPLVAVFLGNLLRDERDEGTWQQIDSMAVTNLRNDSVVSLLKLCYDNLPSHLKPCFAYLALSQGDLHSFGPHQIYIWSAFGLLQTSDEKADIERCGRNYIRELSKSILHDSVLTFSERIVSCKLYYLLLDLAMELLGEDLAVITWNEVKVSHLSRHIVWGYDEIDTLAHKDFPEELLKAKGARTFRLGYHMGRISKSFLEGIICNLRCLYILDLGFSHFEELPLMIEDLIHLRVLNLSFNRIIRYLPTTICKLHNLQGFFLEGCVQLQELPKDLHELVSLKCFIVTTCHSLLDGPEFNNLLALQELQFVSCKNLLQIWGLGGIGCQNSLRRVHFHDCPLLTYLPGMLSDVEELVIDKCDLMDLKVAGLSYYGDLRSLEISGVQACYFLRDGNRSVAMKLEYLLLRDCKQLDSFPEDLFDWFRQLQCLAIDNCPLLKRLPSGICLVSSLEELNIKECGYLSSWCTTAEGISRINHIPLIVIDGCPIAPADTKDLHKELASENEASSRAQISEMLDLPEGGSKEEMMLHFRLFPDGYEFESETLVQLWMASGYFRSEDMEESARGYFKSYLTEGHIALSRTDNLSERQKYKIKVRDIGGHGGVSSDGLYVMLKDENTVAEGTKHQHVSVVSTSIDQTIFETLKKFNDLRTLLFIGNYGPALNQIPSDMFLALPRMETLDLSGSHITELPGSIGNATQLHYLDLSFTLIKRLPETIDRLVELQTLKLNGCKKLFTLPKGMKKLVRLRHLYFDILGQLSIMPSGIGALTELRTLSAFIVDVEKGCNIKELRYMNNLTGSCCFSGLENVSSKDAVSVLENKEHLSRIQLRWDEYSEAREGDYYFPMWYLKPHRCLEKLELFCFPNLTLPSWICEDTCKNLTSIRLLKCANSKLNVSLGTLPNLEYLHITEMNRVERIDNLVLAGTECVGFPKLKKLTIDGMSSLTMWTGIRRTHFPLLSEFNIKRCPKIQFICFLDFLGSLESLEISHCATLESPSDGKCLGKLKSLIIDNCPLLKRKYSVGGEYWHVVEHVQELWIDLINMRAPFEEDSEDTEDGESDEEESQET